jgi:hypothetical protein
MMENPRTTSARDHDDRAMIEGEPPTPTQGGTSGGNLARDNASSDEEAALFEPEGHSRVTKQHDIDNDVARRSDRARGG